MIKILYKCDTCGKFKSVCKAAFKLAKNHFCSYKCAGKFKHTKSQIIMVCKWCGKKKSMCKGYQKLSTNKEGIKFCCPKCAYASYSFNNSVIYKCEVCGKSKKKGRSQFESAKNHFCSYACANIFMTKKEGSLNRSGYVVIRHNKKAALKHRVVMEEILGRALKRHETVHHKNEIRSDNRPDNLELKPRPHGPGGKWKDRVLDAVQYLIESGYLVIPKQYVEESLGLAR
jgi:hypothetical protein